MYDVDDQCCVVFLVACNQRIEWDGVRMNECARRPISIQAIRTKTLESMTCTRVHRLLYTQQSRAKKNARSTVMMTTTTTRRRTTRRRIRNFLSRFFHISVLLIFCKRRTSTRQRQQQHSRVKATAHLLDTKRDTFISIEYGRIVSDPL